MAELLSLKLGPRRGLRRGVSAITWYERGCALDRSDPAAAIEAYRRAVVGRPDLADAHNNLGRLLHDRGELTAAELAYTRAIAADPGIALYWFNLGVVREDRRQREDAITAYQTAIERDPGLADAHFNLARLLDQLGQLGRGDGGGELILRRAVRHLLRYRELVKRR